MSEPRGKSVRQKIAEAELQLSAVNDKMAVTKPTLKTFSNLQEKAAALSRQILELKKIEDQPNLSQTCISYLESWVNEFVYGRRIEFTSKYTTKGSAVEEEAIVYVSGHIPEMGLSSKNLERFANDFLEGEPDVLAEDIVFDMKSSWSHDTFPLYCTEIPETDYDWQVKGYMHLTNRKSGRVVFVLMNMPEEMVLRDAKYKLGNEYTEEEFRAFAAKFNYDDLPPYLRIKEFHVQYDDAAIEAIKKRVEECRWYIENVIIPQLEANAAKYYDPTEEEKEF